jgi:hypothetical protein
VSEILGGRNPLLDEVTSSAELEAGVDVPIPTCAKDELSHAKRTKVRIVKTRRTRDLSIRLLFGTKVECKIN